MMFFVISVLVAAILGIHLWWRLRRPAGMPPGPFGMPFVGFLFSLKPHPQLTFVEKGLKYGKIFTVPMGFKHAVVLNGWSDIKEAQLQDGTYLKRSQLTSLPALTKQSEFVPSSHKIMRRFTLHHLRNLGFGKNSMEEVILNGMAEVLDTLGANCGSTFSIDNHLKIFFMNTLCKLVADQTYSIDNNHIIQLSEELKTGLITLINDPSALMYPWLSYFTGGTRNNYTLILKKLLVLLDETVDEHIATFDEQNLRDYIDIYLSEIYKENTTGDHNMVFQKSELLKQITGLFHASGMGSLNFVQMALAFTATWPEIQEKIQEEIDRVVGRSHSPSYSNKALLPYTEAVILETHRYNGSAFIPRYAVKTTKFSGYEVPKDCFVIRNVWAVNRDPHLWGDPDVFRPERFINANGEVIIPEYLIPFSLGLYSCIGEPLAKMEVFLTLTSIWQNFTYGFPADETPPIKNLTEKILNMQISSPLVFKKR